MTSSRFGGNRLAWVEAAKRYWRDVIEHTAAQHAAECGVTYDTSRTMFMRALARAIGAALRDARVP